MNLAKRIILLCSAIVMIILATVGIGACGYSLGEGWEPVFNTFMILFCIPCIVMGIIMCTKFKWPNNALTIATIAVLGATLLVIIIGAAAGVDMIGFEFFEIPMAFIVLGGFITGLVLNIISKEEQPTQDSNKQNQQSGGNQKEKQIELLKKMKAEGQITEAEYKELLMKELAK